jgi:hypothetical protein
MCRAWCLEMLSGTSFGGVARLGRYIPLFDIFYVGLPNCSIEQLS